MMELFLYRSIENFMISFVVPMYNEENHIISTLDNIQESSKKLSIFEVIIIDDFSSDSSVEIVTQYIKNKNNFKLLTHNSNHGNAAAVDFGVKNSTFDYIILIPGDNTYAHSEISKLIDTFIEQISKIEPFIGIYGIRISESRGFKRELLAFSSRIMIFLLTPSTRCVENIGLILTHRSMCPINLDHVPRNFYHLSLLVNWRRSKQNIVCAGFVKQNIGSSLRSQKITYTQTLKDIFKFIGSLRH